MPDSNNTIVGHASLCVDGVDLGYTSGGITVRRDQEVGEIRADQVAGPIRKYRSSEMYVIATSLLEVTLENLRIVYGYPEATLDSDCLTLGYADPCNMIEHELVVKGVGPGCGCRTWVFDRVVNVASSVEYVMARDAQVTLAVEFEALIDPTTGLFGQVCDGCTFQDSQTCSAS